MTAKNPMQLKAYIKKMAAEKNMENPDQEDLIFGQFENLTGQFIELAGSNTKEQRMDSTQIMTNIKLAGRLSLVYDVLTQAVKACPRNC